MFAVSKLSSLCYARKIKSLKNRTAKISKHHLTRKNTKIRLGIFMILP
jgi:hypothetical protein